LRFEESTLPLRVRPNDLDSLGHVNNATVLEYLEAGRWDWMERHSLRRDSRILPVTSRIEVDYRRELLPQELLVRTALEASELEDAEDDMSYRVYFRQRILLRGGEQVAVEARIQVAFIDSAERTLRTLQEYLAAARAPAPKRTEDL
jgi:acyl-CoA thioester hydrolase